MSTPKVFNFSPRNSSHDLTPIIQTIAANVLKQPEARLKYTSRLARRNVEEFGGMSKGWMHGDSVRYEVAPMMHGQVLNNLDLSRNDADTGEADNAERHIDTGDRRTLTIRLERIINHQHALLAGDFLYTHLGRQIRINMEAGRDALFNTAEQWVINNTYHLIPNVSLRSNNQSSLSTDDMQKLGTAVGMKQDTLDNLDPEPVRGAYGVLTDGRIRAASTHLESFGMQMHKPAVYLNSAYASSLKADQRKQEPDALAMMGYSQGFISESEMIAGVMCCNIDHLPVHKTGAWGITATLGAGTSSDMGSTVEALQVASSYVPQTYDAFSTANRVGTIAIKGFRRAKAITDGQANKITVLNRGDSLRIEGVFDVVAASGDRGRTKTRLPYLKSFSVMEDVEITPPANARAGSVTEDIVDDTTGVNVKVFPGPLFRGPHQNAYHEAASASINEGTGTNGTGAALPSGEEVYVIGAPSTSRTEILMVMPTAFAIPMLPVGVLPNSPGLTMTQVTNQRLGIGMTVSHSGSFNDLRNRTRFDLLVGAGSTLSEYRSIRIPVDAKLSGQQ